MQRGADTASFTTCGAAPSTWRPRPFTYDSLSRLTLATNPESGAINYTYDANSNVLTKTDARGITINYSPSDLPIDPLNRIRKKTYSNGDSAVTYAYDGNAPSGCSPTLSITFGIGRRTGMCDAAGNEAWSYDKMGRVAVDQRKTNGITKSTTYGYNLDGSMSTLNYPSGRTITYTPNSAAQPVSAVDTANSINYATMALYAPQGALRSLINGNGTGILSTLYYNYRLQPCRIAVNATGTAPGSCSDGTNKGDVMDYSYNFNLGASDNGNVYKVSNNRTNASGRNINYTYDSLNRIAAAYTDGSLWGETYSIDAWGNLFGIGPYSGKPAGESLSQGVTTANQFTNACSANCYDVAGDLLNDGANAYSYDAESRIHTGAGVTYTYDGDGKRVQKSNGTLYWYGPSSDALDETDASGNLMNEYIFFGGKRIARRDSSSNVFYYFADHLGTSRAIVQAGQTAPCYDQDFYPYGREVPHGSEVPAFVNTCPQNYKFTGKERDSESGLDSFGARYDSSQYGRFMTPDWSAKPTSVPYAVFSNPQSLNLYSYLQNNPVTNRDPDGHWCLFGKWGSTCTPPPPPPPPPAAPKPPQFVKDNRTFRTVNQAGAAAARRDQQGQQQTGAEHGNNVFGLPGAYTYTDPVTQGEHLTVDPNNTTGVSTTKPVSLLSPPIPLGTDLVGEAHSHPDEVGFSPQDGQRAHDQGLLGYHHPNYQGMFVGLPSGRVIEIDPHGHQTTYEPGEPQ